MAVKKRTGRYTKGPLPSDIRNVTYKKLGGEVTIVPTGVAKEILKKAIASALAKRAASGQSSKALIKTILENKQVQKINPTQQDVGKELYNFYKRNPKYDLTVKTVKGTPVKKSDVIAGRAAAKAERIQAGTSAARVAKPKPKPQIKPKSPVEAKAALKRERANLRKSEKNKAAATKKDLNKYKDNTRYLYDTSEGRILGSTTAAKLKELADKAKAAASNPENSPAVPRKQPTIASREPRINPEKPTINELGAFTKLTDAEKKIFLQSDKDAIQAVINAAKKIKDAPKPTKPVDVNKRLFEASKKLTPAQLKKIQEIVAETRRRAGA